MNIEELVALTKQQDVRVIVCQEWTPNARGTVTTCECCRAAVSAWPVSINKVASDQSFHLLCRGCYEIVARVGPHKFAGRIRDNAMPSAE